MTPADGPDGPAVPTGAARLLDGLVASGVTTCFANPGTSEMHMVAALDDVPAMRPVLALFEGVATGAADGYGRITGHPAATLLHLGPGLSNGLANLHNAHRAATPVVNVVGDHATGHARYNAPLQSDIAAAAGTVSQWYRVCARPEDAVGDAQDAVSGALGPPAGVATLVVPADVAWSPAPERAPRRSPASPPRPSVPPPEVVAEAADALRTGEPSALLLGGRALRRQPLGAAAAVAARTGGRLFAETLPAHMERGAGLPAPERLSYLPELALAQLAGLRHLVLVDAAPPASFFAYPDVPGALWPPDCQLHALCRPAEDAALSLEALADALGAAPGRAPEGLVPPASRPETPTGPLDAARLAQVVAAHLPEDAIVADESNTAGIHLAGATAGVAPHDWLCLSGGAIGQGLPLATGAALAGGGRPVVCLEADGSALYTVQALWTQARESLDVTTVVLANHSYAILQLELARVRAQAGDLATSLLQLDRPELDLVAMAQGLGVPATRATTADELSTQLARALATPGPVLIEAVLPAGW